MITKLQAKKQFELYTGHKLNKEIVEEAHQFICKIEDKMKPKCFILDVDGVLTSGQFLYSEIAKEYKVFGPDDADALNILKNYFKYILLVLIKRI